MSIIAGKNIQDLTIASDTSSNEVGNRISLTSILVTIVGFISLSVCSSPHSQFAFLFSRNICTSTHGSTSEAPFLCRFPGGPIARWLGIVFLAVNVFFFELNIFAAIFSYMTKCMMRKLYCTTFPGGYSHVFFISRLGPSI